MSSPYDFHALATWGGFWETTHRFPEKSSKAPSFEGPPERFGAAKLMKHVERKKHHDNYSLASWWLNQPI